MIELGRQDGIVVMRLAHGSANALDLELISAIVERFRALDEASVDAVVLTGKERMFSAGVDLNRLVGGGADYVRAFLPALHLLYDTVFNFRRPVVAAINGHAIAGGCILACCADRRIAAESAGRIGVTELLVGVPFPAMAFEVMRFATAPEHFSAVMFNGVTFPPQQALERGLIDEIVPADALLRSALAAARQLASLPTRTFELTKQQMRQPVADRMSSHGRRNDTAAEEIWTAPETLERVRVYTERMLKKT